MTLNGNINIMREKMLIKKLNYRNLKNFTIWKTNLQKGSKKNEAEYKKMINGKHLEVSGNYFYK